MNAPAIHIRAAAADDLPAVNRLIESAVMTWDLPDRVKRLSLPSYRYDEMDLRHHITVVAETQEAGIIGVAAWEAASQRDCPEGRTALLLHGLYVDPAAQRMGAGSALFAEALAATRIARVHGLLVKAQADAVGFFLKQGMAPLAEDCPGQQFANRLWRDAP